MYHTGQQVSSCFRSHYQPRITCIFYAGLGQQFNPTQQELSRKRSSAQKSNLILLGGENVCEGVFIDLYDVEAKFR